MNLRSLIALGLCLVTTLATAKKKELAYKTDPVAIAARAMYELARTDTSLPKEGRIFVQYGGFIKTVRSDAKKSAGDEA